MFLKKICLLKTWFFYLQYVIPFFLNLLGSGLQQLQISSGFFLDFKIIAKNIYPCLLFLQKHSLCLTKHNLDIVCFDVLQHKYRFVLVYILSSFYFNFKIRVFSKLDEIELNALSVVSLFRSAS